MEQRLDKYFFLAKDTRCVFWKNLELELVLFVIPRNFFPFQFSNFPFFLFNII